MTLSIKCPLEVKVFVFSNRLKLFWKTTRKINISVKENSGLWVSCCPIAYSFGKADEVFCVDNVKFIAEGSLPQKKKRKTKNIFDWN